jgi:hypothetical protein
MQLLSHSESYHCGINWHYFNHSYDNIKMCYQLNIDMFRNIPASLSLAILHTHINCISQIIRVNCKTQWCRTFYVINGIKVSNLTTTNNTKIAVFRFILFMLIISLFIFLC